MTGTLIKKYIFELLGAPLFWIIDTLMPKRDDLWGFAPHHIKSDQFIENARAVYETIKEDPNIEKIIFAREVNNDFKLSNSSNTKVVYLKSLIGIWYMLRCRVLFVTHSISMDYSLRWGSGKFSVLRVKMKPRVVVNIWHGIPVKKLYALWNSDVRARLDRVKFRHTERKHYAGLITSSKIDSYAMATMFHPIKYEQIFLTGLPRNDFLLMDLDDLPLELGKQARVLQKIKNGKRLITYAPTYRQSTAVSDSAYYQFTTEEIGQLKQLLKKHNAIFGFRMHYFRNDENLFNMESYVDDEFIFDLGHEKIPEIAPVIRESDLVISDYSSVFVEALYVKKALVAFAYDMDHYAQNQDGILYDFDLVFPGPVVQTYESLLDEIDRELETGEQTESEHYQFSQKFFYDYIDTTNSSRVVERVTRLLGG